MDQKLYCEIHDTIRSQYSCIRNECKNRTICIECHQKEQNHDEIGVMDIRARNRQQLKTLFNQLIEECSQQSDDKQQFIEILEQKSRRLLDHKRKSIDVLRDIMIKDSERVVDWLNEHLKYRVFSKKYKMINQIQEEIMQMEIEEQLSKKNFKYVMELYECDEYVHIKDSDKLEQYIQQIRQYEQKQEDYYIWIDFCSKDTSLDWKMEMIKLVDQLKVNHKVGQIKIRFGSIENPIDGQLIRMMARNYQNIYSIFAYDQNNYVNVGMHNLVKQMVMQSVLIKFGLHFQDAGLYRNDDGLELIKEYTEIISQKEDLKWLRYYHSRIGDKYARSKYEIEQLIGQIKRLQ